MNLAFRALALRQSEERDCDLFVFLWSGGAIPLVGKW